MAKKHRTGRSPEEFREFVVKTHHVWIVAVLLIALCVSFFWLGRWYERKLSQYYPGAQIKPNGITSSPESDLTINPEDMEKSVTFFDRLESEDTATLSSPKREQKSTPKSSDDQKRKAPKEVPIKGELKGSFYTVQVLAGNQRSKALRDSDALKTMGFSSYIQEEPQPSGTLYKVRVGKFSSKEEALNEAAKLKKKGYQTWVLKVD